MRRLLAVVTASLAAACANPPSPVIVERVPHGGFQAQALTGRDGVTHLVYFSGDPAHGNLFYVARAPTGTLSTPRRVNSEAGSAIALGSVRGAQLALGRAGRVHVVWNGSAVGRDHAGFPVFYTSMPAGAERFAPQRNLITWADGTDGGGTIAADADGRVFVAWHANPGRTTDAGRGVFLTVADDDGEHFRREIRIDDERGACGCCSMRAAIDGAGELGILYRAAGGNVNRDMTLLWSRDGGGTFDSRVVDPWRIEACPLSTAALAPGPDGLWAAWETRGQIRVGRAGRDGAVHASAVAPSRGAAQKHPVMAVNGDGTAVVAWLEGTGWARGGAVAWQLYGADGRPIGATVTAGQAPAWGLVAVTALPDGRFLLFH